VQVLEVRLERRREDVAPKMRYRPEIGGRSCTRRRRDRSPDTPRPPCSSACRRRRSPARSPPRRRGSYTPRARNRGQPPRQSTRVHSRFLANIPMLLSGFGQPTRRDDGAPRLSRLMVVACAMPPPSPARPVVVIQSAKKAALGSCRPQRRAHNRRDAIPPELDHAGNQGGGGRRTHLAPDPPRRARRGTRARGRARARDRGRGRGRRRGRARRNLTPP